MNDKGESSGQLLRFVLIINKGFAFSLLDQSSLDLCGSDIGKAGNQGIIKVNALQKDILVHALIMVVQQQGGVLQVRDTQSWDADLAQVARVSGGGEDLGLVFDTHALAGVAEDRPPNVGLVNGRQRVVEMSADKLHLDTGLGRDKGLDLGLELLHVKEGTDTDIKTASSLHGDHIELDTTLRSAKKKNKKSKGLDTDHIHS